MDENLDQYSFGELLKILRKRQKGLTQKALAAKIGIARRETIAQWESGDYIPSRDHLQKLIEILCLNKEERLLLLEASVRNIDMAVTKNGQETHISPTLLNIPFPRNAKFTGRRHLLQRLQQALTEKRTVALIQAITGLGGIGKTQTALEYVYRFQQNYQTIFWLNASSQETLFADIVTIAYLLELPEKESREQEIVLVAVKRWLKEHHNWLLIFDNADDVLLMQDFLPRGATGHILLTTRTQLVSPVATAFPIDMMNSKDGSLFLLRRCGLLETDTQFRHFSPELRMLAQEIVTELGGLPLALDQAGAYIQEMGCDLSRYLSIYRKEQASLLKQKNQGSFDYRESVATTWSVSFQRIRRANPTAAELLVFSAFLYPDAIPETLLIEGVKQFDSTFELLGRDLFDESVKDLRRFSLLDRNPETKTLGIHRLVQVVLKDMLDKTDYRQWAERVVLATSRVFPHAEQATWRQCEQLLPQALAAAAYIQQYQLTNLEAGRLLFETASYLQDRARYREAELLYQRALDIRELLLGPDHPDVATTLHNLATLYFDLGKYIEAELLCQRALDIRELQLGPDHLDIAHSLNTRANLSYSLGKYAQAEPFYQRAIRIWELLLGPEHPLIAYPLNNLANLYSEQGKYMEAEPLFHRAIDISELQLGSEHPQVAYPLGGLATLYFNLGRYAEAEPLFQRALHVREQEMGPEHPLVTEPLTNLANLYLAQKEYIKAESFYQRALRIMEQQLGPEHIYVAHPLSGLADLYQAQGNFTAAALLYQRALSIREHALEPQHPDLADTLHAFATLQELQGNFLNAVSLYQRALAIREEVYVPQHPKAIETRKRLIALLHILGLLEEATELELARSEQKIGEREWKIPPEEEAFPFSE